MNFSGLGVGALTMLAALGLALLAYHGPITVESGRRTTMMAAVVNPVVEAFGTTGGALFFAAAGLAIWVLCVVILKRL